MTGEDRQDRKGRTKRKREKGNVIAGNIRSRGKEDREGRIGNEICEKGRD